MFACIHAPGIAASGCAGTFSPRVEEIDADTVVLDAAGLERLIGPPRRIAEAIVAAAGAGAHVAIACNRDAAIHAARGFAGITVIPPGEEAGSLGGLPVELLAPPPEILETFDRWGIHAFRDLAALPPVGVAERLGESGVRLQKLARGEWSAPLRPAQPPPAFESSIELEHPLELLEPLSFVLSRLLHDICARLEEHALAAIGLRFVLRLENGEHVRALRLPVPMRNPKVFLKLAQLDLAAHPPPSPVVAVAIAADPSKPRATQEGLFLPPTPEPEKLELTLARIAALVGANNVGSPELLNTHHPAGHVLTSPLPRKKMPRPADSASCRLAFRYFRPPLAAQVRPSTGPPVSLAARGIQGKVLAAAGPWRTAGDWWTPTPWARDDWDIALAGDVLYRIYQELATGLWFVEGSYD